MNLFAELMEFLPASGAINLPVGQQRAIWNRILCEARLGLARWYHLLSFQRIRSRDRAISYREAWRGYRDRIDQPRYTMPANRRSSNDDEDTKQGGSKWIIDSRQRETYREPDTTPINA